MKPICLFFDKVTSGPWQTAGLDVQYKLEDDVLAFQCTVSESDWRYNFKCWPKEFAGYWVHSGFADLYNSVRDIVRALEFDTVAGFSQGGALATLAALDNRGTRLVTFASPKVFLGSAVALSAENYVVRGDPVPMLPPFFSNGPTINIGPWSILSFKKHEPNIYREYLNG